MFTLPKPYKFSASSVPARTVTHPLDRTVAWTSASLGDATGLTQLGVYLNRVAPHTTSTVLHWHSENDEWIYILDAGDSRPGPSVHIDPKSNTDPAPAPDAALPVTPNTKPSPDAIPIEATVKLIPDATRNTGTNTSTSTNTNTSTITITNTITNTDTNANLPPSPTIPPPPSAGAKLLILAEGANVPVEEPLHTGDFLGFAAGRRDAHALRAGDKELVYLVGGTRREHDVCFYPTQKKRLVADGNGRAGGPVFVEDKDVVACQRPRL